jgi:hypothetical protein
MRKNGINCMRVEDQIQHFYSLAGIINPPPVMFNQISTFVISHLANFLLDRINYIVILPSENTEDVKTRINIVRQKLFRYVGAKQPFEKFFKFNFTGWRNNFIKDKDMSQEEKNDIILGNLHSSNINGVTVHVGIIKNEGGEKGRFNWDDFTMTVNINLPKDVFSADLWSLNFIEDVVVHLSTYIEDIYETVSHELIHMVQAIGNILIGMPLAEAPGLPPRKIRNKEPALEIIEQTDKRQGEPLQDTKSKERKPHHLSDVEFYTILNDVIKQFKFLIHDLPREIAPLFFRIYTGTTSLNSKNYSQFPKKFLQFVHPNQELLMVKSDDPKRWQEMIRKMVIELEDIVLS